MSWVIYTLSCPASGDVRYVGFTSQTNPQRRMNEHRRSAVDGRTRVYCWWRKCVRELEAEPIFAVIDRGLSDPNVGLAREREWIAHYRAEGARLTNLTDGGEGVPGFAMPPEARAKTSAAHRGRKQSPEWVERRMASHRGKTVPAEQRERMSRTIADRGSWGPPRMFDDQTLADIRASITGRPGERAALAQALGCTFPTIKRALDENLWSVPDDVIGRPIPITPHEKWSGETHPAAKTTHAQVREIRRRYDGGERCVDIAADLDIRLGRVQKIAYRDVFKNVA